jgi:CheY-like chemotaxis protein
VPHTLLLADDSVTIQRVIELTFADEDIEVVAVSNGDQAIERVEAQPPDIVLADIGMPGRNGYEVARHIKQSPRLSHIPVLLLTGAFEPVDQARAAEAGCDGVLAKPFEPQLVIGRVKELLARVPRRPAPPANPRSEPPVRREDAPRATALEDVGELPDIVELPDVPQTPKPSPGDLDAYFDRLDAAFDKLSKTPTSTPAPNTARTDTGDLDWLVIPGENGAPPARTWDLPLADAERTGGKAAAQRGGAPSGREQPERAPRRTAATARADTGDLDWLVIPGEDGAPPYVEPSARDKPAPAPSTSAATPSAAAGPLEREAPAALPSLADAFAALLAAEQNDTNAPSDAWPELALTTDELVERVARVVYQRIADQISPDKVAAIVSETAERLVRQEIERIKASIK